MVEGKAASTKRPSTGTHTRQKSGFKQWEVRMAKRPAQPPIQPSPSCPECSSKKLWKDGIRYTSHGEVQRWLCRACGYRFSDSKVKVNVSSQVLEKPDSRKDFSNPDVATGDLIVQPFREDSLLQGSENISSHQTHPVSITAKDLNSLRGYSRERRVCDERNGSRKEHGSPVQMKHHGSGRAGVPQTTGAKNLVKSETRIEKQAAGATKRNLATIKGKIIEYLWHLKKQGYAKDVVNNRVKAVQRLVDLGADLWSPESVKEILAKQEEWKDSYKLQMVYAYESFLAMEGLAWQRPRYKAKRSIPFIPTEQELDQLIAGVGKKIGAFLQGLKDTGADPGELVKLRWIDVNRETRNVSITPVKGHNPRVLKVSQEFLRRLGTLPRKSEYVFSSNAKDMGVMFWRSRQRLARKLNNPRLKAIHFTTFRHWKGTMEYHRTHNLIHVQEFLGHKNIQNTVIYVHLEALLFDERNDDFHVTVAKNVEEACKLIKVGFEYVTGEYDDGGKIFRKRK